LANRSYWKFLPAQLSEAEVEAVIAKIIAETAKGINGCILAAAKLKAEPPRENFFNS
jgi:uncharacterized protein YqeY